MTARAGATDPPAAHSDSRASGGERHATVHEANTHLFRLLGEVEAGAP